MRRRKLYALSIIALALFADSTRLCLAAKEKPKRLIFYAVKDIFANDQRISEDMIRDHEVPEDVLKPNTAKTLTDVVGKYAKRDIKQGETIFDSDLEPVEFKPLPLVINLTQTQLDQLTVVAKGRTLSNSVIAREFVMKAVAESLK